MTAKDLVTDLDGAVEATARAMYVSRYLERYAYRFREQGYKNPEKTLLSCWDRGKAGVRNYEEFRALPKAAVPAVLVDRTTEESLEVVDEAAK
jgi:hypothetical protein